MMYMPSASRFFRVLTLTLIFQATHMRAADEGGWNKAKWGATEAELRQIYPEAEPLKAPTKYVQQGRNYVATLGIARFEIAGEFYSVNFLMDQSNRLGAVILRLDGAYHLTPQFQSLKQLLTEKYGKPTGEEPTSDGGQSVNWSTPSASISINDIVLPASRRYFITLIYRKPNSDALNKL